MSTQPIKRGEYNPLSWKKKTSEEQQEPQTPTVPKALENFPTEKTRYRVNARELPQELEPNMANVAPNSMLYAYNKMRREAPSILDLMAMGKDEMEEPLPM